MITLFNTPIDSPIIIAITVIYFFTSSITTFDIRMIQAKRNGTLPANEPMLPSWVGIFIYIGWIIGIALILLNWKYAIAVFIIRFILKVLPVLETVGNILMSPFRPKKK